MNRLRATAVIAAAVSLACAAEAPAATSGADLRVRRVSTLAATVRAGDDFAGSALVGNIGRRAARTTTTAFYLSRDARRSRDDVRLGRGRLRALRPRAAVMTVLQLHIRSRTTPGRYRLLACADAAATLRERNERNNCSPASAPLTVAPAAGGAVTVGEQTAAPASPGAGPAPAVPQPEATVPTNPFAARALYVDPYSAAAQQAAAWRSTRPQDAALIDKIAAQAQPLWLGDWDADVRQTAAARVQAANAAGRLSLFVAYNIPARDCGGQSAGGAASPDAYREWIRQLQLGLGAGPAVVILEPDALAHIDCLSPAAQATRLELLNYAVEVLSSPGAVSVYIDSGHSRWLSADVMAPRLQAAGVAKARGFSLNVSNYGATSTETAFGRAISDRIGGKPFVIDTGRNGNGPPADDAWCNPPGRALGAQPSTATGDARIDAFLWIKNPGESDGTCNGGPPAGQWWPERALELAAGAHW